MKKVLVANRGEIAVRVIRACRELGLQSVAVYSEADRDSLHTKLADESVCIGKAPSSQSYLNMPAIMAAAEISGADAVHPGYGFLSENAHFADVCQKCGFTFIGPSAWQMRQLGAKVAAREVARQAGLPFLPGGQTALSGPQEARETAKRIGLPVILKASGGGGGRGMKIVHDLDNVENAFLSCQSEARAAFGNPDVYVEKYLENPRHVEVQILADHHGNVVHFGERDCSVQRRHQKVIEEAPCPHLSDADRARIGQYAVSLAQQVGYHGAGTVEFLMDDERNVYFMEMNTRIQVEHPVTELVTGFDLVREQILIACGEKLSVRQADVHLNGHAIECRINAEDPDTFAPWPGKVTAYAAPGGPGVRVDSFIYHGYTVVPHYDSLLSKVIVHAPTRERAIACMKRALHEYVIEGIRTNIPFHRKVLNHPVFLSARHSTRFLEQEGFLKGKKS
jgi:acetyl-CoA carboxylase biotin carboxylase subunit